MLRRPLVADGRNLITVGEETVCNLVSQGCNRSTQTGLRHCAKIRGFDKCCYEDETWTHHPDSPWGDIDICAHGVTRDHGDTKKYCIYCDYPEDSVWTSGHCPNCHEGTVQGHFLNGKCLRCGCED